MMWPEVVAAVVITAGAVVEAQEAEPALVAVEVAEVHRMWEP
jgi:hypothetical protein